MSVKVKREGTDVSCAAAMAFSLLLFRCGRVAAIKFFDAAGFDQVKLEAIVAVQSLEAEDAEVHDDCAGLVYRYSQVLN